MMLRVVRPFRNDNGDLLKAGSTFTVTPKDKHRYRHLIETGMLRDVETEATRTAPHFGRGKR